MQHHNQVHLPAHLSRWLNRPTDRLSMLFRSVNKSPFFGIASAIALVCLFFLLSAPANSETQELSKVRKQLSEVVENLGATKNKHQKAQKSLERVERDIAERSLRQQQTQTKLNDLELQSSKLILQKDVLNTEYLHALQEVKSLLISTYKMGRQNGLKRLLSQEDPTQISRFAQYANYVTDSRKQLIEQTLLLADQASNAETELNNRSQQLAKLNLVLEKDQTYLGQLKQNRLSTLDQLDGEIADQSSKAQQLKDKQARLTKLVNQLAKQRSKKLKQSKAHEKIYSSRTKSSATSNSHKEASKQAAAKAAIMAAGSLPLPVKATLVAKFGQKRSESGIPWSGILLKGSAGTEVHSIATGEVVYADWLTGYGQLIIIDHGNELMSLYG
ncbi:MAG: septal ring factor EnvC (AmiA/AmiB activator), partial [Gammaproteobacteria bacterium]